MGSPPASEKRVNRAAQSSPTEKSAIRSRSRASCGNFGSSASISAPGSSPKASSAASKQLEMPERQTN